jgi:hypothetical protein
MSDEPTFPPPESFALDSQPAINPDLIRKYASEGRIDFLISLFDHQHRSMHRAEALARAYYTHNAVLHKMLAAIRAGELPGLDYEKVRRARKTSDAIPSGGKTIREATDNDKARAKKTSLDLAIDL